MGSDHPTLPPDHLQQAFDRLGTADAVFGPTPDGGYYAAGLGADAWPRAEGLFRNIPWSTPEVLETTEARGRELGLVVELLPGWYDVDEPEDLERLRRDLEADSATARALARLAGGRG